MSNPISMAPGAGVPGVGVPEAHDQGGGEVPYPPSFHPGPTDVKVLIAFDRGFVMRIEAEQEVVTGGTGRTIPRTVMIRLLLKEALDARARARGEQVPWAYNVGRLESEVEAETEAA